MPRNDDVGDQISELSTQVKALANKVDAMDQKLTKIEDRSTTIMNNTQTLIASTELAKTNEIMGNTISDPNGFIARELTNQLYQMLQKYQSTDFRRWLATRGRNVVESSIASFVSGQLPQLRWYGVSITKLDEKKYHQKAKTSFPVELSTGIPVISKITLTKCVFEIEGDVDVDTKEIANLKSQFTTGQEEKKVFQSLTKDIDESLKPHRTAYGILSPIGRGLNMLWTLMRRETNFSIPFALLLLATIWNPAIWPANLIYFNLLHAPYIWFWLLGINIQSLILGIINGAFYGAIVWVAARYKLLDKINVLKKLKLNISESGGRQIDFRKVGLGAIAVVVIVVGAWYLMLPKPIDVTAVRAYSDPAAETILVSLETSNYTTASRLFDQNMKATMSQATFEQTSANLKAKIGSYTGKVFWKVAYENNYVAAYYNATYTNEASRVTVRLYFTEVSGQHLVSSLWLDSPNLRN